MRAFSSTLGLILLVFMFVSPAPAGAQSGPAKLELGEPFKELQYAFANGFETAVRHIHEEMKAGRLTPAKLEKLAANKNDRLKDLILKMAKEYQATLVRLNAAKQKKPGED